MKKLYILLSAIVATTLSSMSFASSSEIDWCNNQWDGINNGEEITTLDLLGLNPIPEIERFPFTESEIEALVQEANNNGDMSMYIETVESIKYLHIVEDPDATYLEDPNDPTSEVPIGTLSQTLTSFISNLNTTETNLNDYGLSLREQGDFLDGHEQDEDGSEKGLTLYEIFSNPDSLEDQLLEAFRLEAAQQLGSCLRQIAPENCPQLDHDDFYQIPGVEADTKLPGDRTVSITVEQFIDAVNTTALAACAVNHSILIDLKNPSNDAHFQLVNVNGFTLAKFKAGALPGDLASALSYITPKLDLAFTKLSSDAVISPLLLDFKAAFGSFEDFLGKMQTELNSLAAQFAELIGFDLGSGEGGGDDDGGSILSDIPNIFEFEAVEAPAPPPLAITKEYDWVGIDMGSQSTVAVDVNAHAELRASETEIDDPSKAAHAYAHYAAANADATLTVGFALDEPMVAHLANAFTYAYVGMDSVSADIQGQIFGQAWPINDEDLGIPLASITKEIPFEWNQSHSFFETVIMVGPIPLRLRAGAYVASSMNSEFGLMSMKAYARTRPSFAAGMTASAILDVIVASAGAVASLTAVDIGIPFVAQAALLHDEGKPYLEMNLNGHADYSFLDGNISTFVKYYVPRVGIPPWKQKRINKVLFKWTGMSGQMDIFSWGATLGHDGMKLRGGPLAMGIEELDEGSTLDDRVRAIITYQNATNVRVSDSVGAIASQLNNRQDILAMSQAGLTTSNELDRNIDTYINELIILFNSEDPDQRDPDGDGLPDNTEIALGTDINNPDSDGDGIDDGYEASHPGLDPLNAGDAHLDADGDGYTNLEEYLASSDPNNAGVTPENIGIIILIPIINMLLH